MHVMFCSVLQLCALLLIKLLRERILTRGAQARGSAARRPGAQVLPGSLEAPNSARRAAGRLPTTATGGAAPPLPSLMGEVRKANMAARFVGSVSASTQRRRARVSAT
jgi:hypothetical protein